MGPAIGQSLPVAVTLAVALLAGAGTDDAAGTPLWAALGTIVLGMLLLLVAARQWSGRPRAGVEPPAARWMAAIDGFTPVRTAGLAVLLGAVNPRASRRRSSSTSVRGSGPRPR